jgi:WD40 repeat protein
MTVAAPRASALRSPYKGLAPFEDSEQDALLFFGRERECEVVVANMLATRVTVLYGESGVGKSSLLAAGVARELRVRAPGAAVVLRDTWSAGASSDPLDRVRGMEEAYLILDQFEEYFLYFGDDDSPGTLVHDLPELLRDSRLHVLVSLREDALSQLDAFKARLPSVFANQVRLEHLDGVAARAAILGPIDRWNEVTGEHVEVEAAFVDVVIHEVAVEGRSERIEAPYLQLVLERIWDTERAAGSTTLRVGTLRALGGARAIVRDHLLHALAALPQRDQDVAASVFEQLVTPSGTKIAHRAADLAEYANVPEDALRRVLTTLTRDRIVHSVDGSDRYEIFHDVLAEPIRAWREERRLERERVRARRRQRRVYILFAASLVALGVVAGLAAWAFSERSSAQAQARHAHARVLEATALQQLSIDPNKSVRLALAGTRLEPGRVSEDVLRQALTADRLRIVRHLPGKVGAVALSPDGRLIAAGVAPNRVLLIDTRTRLVTREIPAGSPVAALDFARGGSTIVAASRQGVADAWDVRTGRRLQTSRPFVAARDPAGGLELVPLGGALADEISRVRRLSGGPGGSRLAAAIREPDGRVRAWLFARDGSLVRVLPDTGVTDIAFSPDGRLVATASAGGETTVWHADTGLRVRTLLDSKNGTEALAFGPDSSLLATGGEDGGVRIWTVATGIRTYFLFGHTNPVTALAWSPDGSVVASASPDRTVRLWRVHGLIGDGSLAATLSGNDGAVRALAFSADGKRLVTGGDDATVRMWDARPDEELDLLGRAPGSAVAAAWAGRIAVGLWSSGVVKTYDPTTRRRLYAFRTALRQKFTALGVSRDGSVIAAGGSRGVTELFDGRTGARLPSLAGKAPVTAVAVAPGGDLVAGGDRRGVVRVWNPSSGALLWSARQRGKVQDVAFSPHGDLLVTAGSSGTVVWSAATGHLLHPLPSPRGDREAVFSPDGLLVATAGTDANARLWHAATGSLYRLLRGHTLPVTGVAFSDDSRRLATSGADSDGRIWSVGTGAGFVLQRSAFGPVRSISFDRTGQWVAAAGPISVLVWSAHTGRQQFYLRGHKALPTAVSFAPKTATLLSSSRDGTLRTYTCNLCIDGNGLVRFAELRIARTR